VSGAVSHLVSSSGVCVRLNAAVVHYSQCHCAAAVDSAWCYGLHVGYQCLALEPDALLTYVAGNVIIITTRAVVMPKSQSTPLSTEADFSCSKYTKMGEYSEGCPGWESLRIADREGPASFLKLL